MWKDIPGFEGFYQVSNYGQVRSLDREVSRPDGRTQIYKGIVRKQTIIDGYLRVTLSRDGKSRLFRVHRLVLMTFVGACPSGMECCHSNGNRMDNHLSNLYWGTKVDNWKDRKEHGFGISGEDHHLNKLTEADVLEIRRIHSLGDSTQGQIAKEFGIHRMTVSRIVRRIDWKHSFR